MAASSVRDLRIVLIGKNDSENSRVANTILGTTAFYSEAPSSNSQHLSQRISGWVEERHVTVIKTSNLLQPNLREDQTTQTVCECVSLSAPGPHVILLILQYRDFSETDRHRVKHGLNLFSKQALKHTIVLTTDEVPRLSKLTGIFDNTSFQNIIKDCGGRHLKVDAKEGWRFQLFRKIEEIFKEEHENILIGEMYKDRGDGSSVDGETGISGGSDRGDNKKKKDSDHEEDGKLKDHTKAGSDAGVSCSGKAKLNIVLCGNNTTLKISVSKLFRGKLNKPISKPEKESKECVKKEGKMQSRQISVIELPALTRLSEQEVMHEIHHCVSLCDPGVHLFILVAPVTPLTDEDEAEMQKIKRAFFSKEHFMVLFTTDRTVDQSVTDCVASKQSQRIVSLYGSWHSVMELKDKKNSTQISELLDYIDRMKTEPYSLQVFLSAPERRVKNEQEEKLSVKKNQIKQLQDKINTLEGVKLNLVLCGSKRGLKSFISNMFCTENKSRSKLSSECVTEVELNGRLIRLVELPDLIGLSEEEVMRQTLCCASLCHPGVHLFLLIIPDSPLDNEEKAEIEEIQKMFSSRVNKHLMILIKQSSGDKKRLDEETQAVIQRFGGRQHFIEENTQVSTLMKDIEQMLSENRELFTTEKFLEPQMEKIRKFDEMKRRIHSLETWFQSQVSRDKEDELRIVLLGKTGVGKSSTGNTILGREEFTSDISQTSVTKECQKQSTEINGRQITVIDTPGLFDTKLTNEEIKREISHCISMILPGPHVFLLLITLGRFTQEEQDTVKIIQENFGENSLTYTIVLFTRGDDLKNKTIDHFLGKSDSVLKNLIETCGNRVHVFNNNQTGDRTQVSELLEKIDNMVKTNGGSYYSCKMFREMERGIQEQREKIMLEEVERLKTEKEELVKKHKEDTERMMEEERQKQAKDRKRREEEFNDRENRYKRNIKEREEEERKLQEKMKREREEWEKQGRQERERKEEEEERRRKIEKETWDEYYQTLKRERERRLREKEDLQFKHEEEKERMKKMMEEQRQNFEKERTRIEEENIEREIQYKRDIKDIDDYERQMQEEMEREREQWEKQKQQERQNEEEENERQAFIQLYETTSKVQQQNNYEDSPSFSDDEDSPSDAECLRILLFGRKGVGKSATGNTILGKNVFRSEASTHSVTITCQKGVGEVNGRSVVVVDTPDLFDMRLTNKQVVEEIAKCMSMSAPGPHVFIIVLSLVRITQNEKDILDVIKMIFGQKSAKFCIVLFTGGDDLAEQTIKQYVEKSKNDELKKMIKECENRLLVFNNRQTEDQTQVTELLNMICEVTNTNQEEKYFSNEMFEEAAISTEERMKILEENETQNQEQVKELEAKYAMDVNTMIKRLKEKKQRTDEERVRLENTFREQEETLRREFEEKEKSEQKKREKEEQKRSELEKQLRDEYEEKLEEMKREIEDRKSEYEDQHHIQEKYKEEKKREEKYKEDQEKMEKDHEHVIAELKKGQREEIKKRDLEEQNRKKQEEKEREEWKRKTEDAQSDKKDIIEGLKREWEEKMKREMREREEVERTKKERYEKQLREKQEELEKIKKRFERQKEEERQNIEEERQKKKREKKQREGEYEEKLNEIKMHYEQLVKEREEEWKRREREDEERQQEKRKRWRKMIDDLHRDQEEIFRKVGEERERTEREEKECNGMLKKQREEIEKIKRKHQDEARKEREKLDDFNKRKEQHIQELKERLEEFQKQLNELKN